MSAPRLAFVVVAFLLAGCSGADEGLPVEIGTAAPSSFTSSSVPVRVTPAPVTCGNLACVAQAARTCAPTSARVRKQSTSGHGTPLTIDYRIGITGYGSNGDCLLYYKLLSAKAEGFTPGTYNYASCSFHDTAWMSDYLAKDQFIGDIPLPDQVHFVLGATQGGCAWSTVPDALHSPLSEMLIPGQEIRDDDTGFSLRLDSLDFLKSATMTVRNKGVSETFTLLPGDTAEHAGMTFSLGEFGQKNTFTDEGFKEAVDVTVTLR